MISKINFFESPTARQTILSLCIAMSFFYIGLVRGYSAPAVPSIMENDPELLPTKNIASWASSVPPCGAFFGSVLAGPLLYFFGRKYTILVASPLGTLAWILIATSKRYEVFIAARFLCGFCVGLCLPSAQVYIGESCDPKIRGILGSLPTIFMSLAILIAYIIGSVAKWDTLAWYCSSMALLFGVLLAFLPESPIWLRSKNRFEEAELSANWLKLPSPSEIIAANPKINIKMKQNGHRNSQHSGTADQEEKVKFFSRPIILPLIIGLTLLVLQQISGIDAIIFFTVEIFKASGSSINEHLATILVGFVQLVSNIAAVFVVDKSGRKPLLIISAVVMALSTGSMGAAFFLKQMGIHSFGWLPLTSLVIYMIGFSIGFGCIPFLLLGELFPVNERSVLSSIAGSFNLGVMFIVIKTYHYLEALITTAGTFWMYSIFCLIAIFFVIFVVPETKGRDLESIAQLFAKNSSKTPAASEQLLATAAMNKAYTSSSMNSLKNGIGSESDVTKL